MISSRKSTVVSVGVIALLSLGLAACSDSDSNSSTTTTSQTGTTAVSGPKPQVTIPDSPPPTELVKKDIKVGTGAEAKAGTTISANYVGVAYSTKKEFDNSYDRGQPISFPLGGGRVIPGWDQGIAGMKVGGQRELIIPPALGYPDGTPDGSIKPGETLVFIVDLVAVK